MRIALVVRWTLGVLLVLTPLGGCGGGSGGGGEGGDGVEVTLRGRVVLGWIANAQVQVLRHDDLVRPRGTGLTQGGSVETAGRFEVALEDVSATDLFVVVVRGGRALDRDEDGGLDPVVQDNLGVVHAVVTGAQIRARLEILVSVLSEVVYQRVRYLLAAEYPATHVVAAAVAATTFLLERSLDGDLDVDDADGLRYDGRRDPTALFRSNRGYDDLAIALLDGDPVTEAAFGLSEPSLAFHDFDPGSTLDVDLQGELVFLAGGSFGLLIRTLLGEQVGAFNTPDSAEAVQVVGQFAYVADGTSLQIVDVQQPGTPLFVGRVTLPGASRLHVVGNRAYVLDPGAAAPQLLVVDVGDPRSPAVLGRVATLQPGERIVSDGSVVYVAHGGQFIETFDVRNPAAPRPVGTFSLPRDTAGMVLHDGRLCVTTVESLEVFDRADPAQPTLLGRLSLPPFSVPQSSDIASFGDRLAIPSAAGLFLVDMTDPANPVDLGVLPAFGSLRNPAFGAGHVVATDSNGGFEVFAAGTPPPSAVVGSVSVSSSLSGVDAVPGRAWVGSRIPAALVDIDLSDPELPVVVGSAPLPALARDVRVDAGRAYVASNGLSVVDVSVPGAPVHLGTTAAPGSHFAVDAGVGAAWTASNVDRLVAWDVSDPALPAVVTTVATATNPNDVSFDGASVLVVTDGSGALHTFDVTSPLRPTPRGTLAMTNPLKVVARPGFAFVTNVSLVSPFLGGLDVVDTSSLPSHRRLGSVLLPGHSDSLAVAGDHAFVGSLRSSVHVVDVSRPDLAFRWATLPVAGEIRNVAVAGTSVLVVGAREVSVLRGIRRSVP